MHCVFRIAEFGMRKSGSPSPNPLPGGAREYLKNLLSPRGEDKGEGDNKSWNNTPITIRHARPGDIPRMCELLAELFSIESDFVPDREKQAHGLGALIAQPPGKVLVLVAISDGLVVGMATVQTLISTAEGGRVGLVEDVVVDRAFRSLGIGTLLLEEIAVWSRRAGLKRLQLLADRDNQLALDFYFCRGLDLTKLVCLRKIL
jgi:GNAT superfamily N-acetyltransferase